MTMNRRCNCHNAESSWSTHSKHIGLRDTLFARRVAKRRRDRFKYAGGARENHINALIDRLYRHIPWSGFRSFHRVRAASKLANYRRW